jgi:hypothetical protein
MNPRIAAALIALAAALVGATGLVAQAVGREIVVMAQDNNKYLPSVAYNNNRQEFLVVWHDNWGGSRDIWGARLDRFGRVLSTFNLATGGNDRAQPAAAYDSVRDRYLVVWIYDFSGSGSDWDLNGRLVPWYGPDAGLTEFTIYNATDSQWTPKVAYSFGDDEYLVVWGNTSTTSNASISYRFVLANGTPDYAQTLAGDGSNNYLNPVLTYNQLRNEYLAAYEVNGVDIAARRLNYYGALGSQVMVADWPDAETAAAVAACPGQDQWLVVWQNSGPKVYARFLTGAGAVDGAPVDVFNAFAGRQREPAVACLPGGGQYLISWEQEYSGAVFGIWGRQLGTNHSLLAPGFTIRTVYGPQLRNAATPAVVGSPLGWSVSWIQEREGSSYSDVHAAMVWALFADDFESGNTGFWSSVQP